MVMSKESTICWYPFFKDKAKRFSGLAPNPPAAPAAVKPLTDNCKGSIKNDSAQFTNWFVLASDTSSKQTSDELFE
jgi:hypothetical protein